MHKKGQETYQRRRKGGGGEGYTVLIQHGQNPNAPLAKRAISTKQFRHSGVSSFQRPSAPLQVDIRLDSTIG